MAEALRLGAYIPADDENHQKLSRLTRSTATDDAFALPLEAIFSAT